MNPFKKFNEKSLDDPLPFTPEGRQGGGFVFNHKKNGLSKRTYMSRSLPKRWLNGINFALINVGIPLGVAIFCWNSFSFDSPVEQQLILAGIIIAAAAWIWVTLPYTLFFIRIIKQS